MKKKNAKQASRKCHLFGLLFIGSILFSSAFPADVSAGLILGAELQFTYEDNVVGLLSDQQRGSGASGSSAMPVTMSMAPGMGGGSNKNRYTGSASGSTASPADFYATISAEAGGYKDLDANASVFAKGFANHSSYDTYTDLDATIGGVSTGVIVSLSDRVTALGSVLGKIKTFGDSQRNSTAYEGALSLKEKLPPSFWLREYGNYEKNDADSGVFSYRGTKIGVSAGYNFSRTTVAAIGYSYLVQEYEEPAGATLRTGTAFASAEQALSRSWFVSAEYDLQTSRDSASGANTTNNIYSLSLRYSY